MHEKYRFFLVFFGPLSLCFVFCEKIFCKIQHNCKKTFYKVALEFFEFDNLFNFSKNFQILCKIEKIEKKILGNCSIERIRIMSGSCHLDRASSVKIGVECQIFVNVIFLTVVEFCKATSPKGFSASKYDVENLIFLHNLS